MVGRQQAHRLPASSRPAVRPAGDAGDRRAVCHRRPDAAAAAAGAARCARGAGCRAAPAAALRRHRRRSRRRAKQPDRSTRQRLPSRRRRTGGSWRRACGRGCAPQARRRGSGAGRERAARQRSQRGSIARRSRGGYDADADGRRHRDWRRARKSGIRRPTIRSSAPSTTSPGRANVLHPAVVAAAVVAAVDRGGSRSVTARSTRTDDSQTIAALLLAAQARRDGAPCCSTVDRRHHRRMPDRVDALEGRQDVLLPAQRHEQGSNDLDRRHIWGVPLAGGTPKMITAGDGIENVPVVVGSNKEDRGPEFRREAAVLGRHLAVAGDGSRRRRSDPRRRSSIRRSGLTSR